MNTPQLCLPVVRTDDLDSNQQTRKELPLVLAWGEIVFLINIIPSPSFINLLVLA